MLQYITTQDTRHSLSEQMQMAIEGGCSWIVIGYDGTDDSELRTIADEFLPLCKETSTILTFENRPELARDLGVHGVLLSDKKFNAPQLRQELGPEAIIGVVCDSVPAIDLLCKADIDYVQFPPMPLERIAGLVAGIRESGIKMPLVASGNFTPSGIPDVIAAGVNGIATTSYIADSANPVEATEEMIAALKGASANN